MLSVHIFSVRKRTLTCAVETKEQRRMDTHNVAFLAVRASRQKESVFCLEKES